MLTLNMIAYLRKLTRFRCFFYGLLLPLSFAPFHMPGFAIISLGLFYNELNSPSTASRRWSGFWQELLYGLGVFGFGTSWVYVSIHEYGHLNSLISAAITLLFVLYLSLFTASAGSFYRHLQLKPYSILSIMAFASFWTLSEYLRATLFTGFPWLLVGMGQIDAPMRNLLPILGVYGVTFLTCIAASLLIYIFKQARNQRLLPVSGFLLIVLLPQTLAHLQSAQNPSNTAKSLSVGIVQSNVSMRDKWDEALFWKLLEQYQKEITHLLGTDLIVLPEAAFPVPASYIQDILKQMSNEAKQAGSAILVGVPQATAFDDNVFYNALMGLGEAEGTYLKQHLVPFGEYNPRPLRFLTRWIELPSNMEPGSVKQPLITVQQVPIATLICYELAYGDLLRKQIPTAQFIVSISDDGWFGHSLAMYQQQQIAQIQSLQTGRYQVMANNDGLSSVIDDQGYITDALTPFSAGVLKATLIPRTTLTTWVTFGDYPIVVCIGLISLVSCFLSRRHKTVVDNPLSEEDRLPLNRRGAILTGQLENNE